MLRILVFVFIVAPFISKAQVAGSDSSRVNVNTTRPAKLCLCCGPLDASRKPLYIINGVAIADTAVSTIDPQTIISINVLKGEEALKTYGPKAANGVIEIVLKGNELTKAKSPLPPKLVQ